MEREGLGRGIDDISHFFLSARARRMEGGATAPKPAPGQLAGAEVWPVIRVGQSERSAAEAWSVARRLASPGQWVLHLAVAPEGTEVRACGEPTPAGEMAPADAFQRAGAVVADLTAAGDPAREGVLEAAGRLILLTGTTEADTLAAYSLLKHGSGIPAETAVSVAVAGCAEAAAQAFARLASAARYFLGRTLCDWREAAAGPEPNDAPLPLLGIWPTDTVLARLAEAASDRPRLGQSPRPSVARLERKSDDSTGDSVSRPLRSGKTSSGRADRGPRRNLAGQDQPGHTPDSNPGMRSPDFRRTPAAPPPPAADPSETLKPLVAWPDPDVQQLADFVERHPYLVQPGLTVVDRGLHDCGDGVVDLLAVDEGGRAAVVLVAVSGGADLLTAALAYGRWCLREAQLLRRLNPRLRLAAATPPRVTLAACWFDDSVAEAVRMVNRPAVSLVELRAYDLAGERGVAVARVA